MRKIRGKSLPKASCPTISNCQGTTNQVSSGAKHPATWKQDIFVRQILFGVLLQRWRPITHCDYPSLDHCSGIPRYNPLPTLCHPTDLHIFPINTCIAYAVFLPKMCTCSLGHLQCWHHLWSPYSKPTSPFCMISWASQAVIKYHQQRGAAKSMTMKATSSGISTCHVVMDDNIWLAAWLISPNEDANDWAPVPTTAKPLCWCASGGDIVMPGASFWPWSCYPILDLIAWYAFWYF